MYEVKKVSHSLQVQMLKLSYNLFPLSNVRYNQEAYNKYVI